MQTPEETNANVIDTLYHRARIFILGYQAPISRLKLDVTGVDKFDVPGPTTPTVAMLMALPDFTPPAREIVRLTVHLFGHRLFSLPSSRLLKGYAVDGPIASAESILLMDHPTRMHALRADLISDPRRAGARYNLLIDGFESIFARHPQLFLERARRILTPYATPPGPG